MILSLLLLLATAPHSGDPVAASLESFSRVASYTVTIRSKGDDSSQIIRYFYKRPGFVRMEFVSPHNGAVLVYSPLTEKARLRPFGFFKSMVLTLDPGSSLIRGPQGRRVDRSDLGALLETVKTLAEKGKTGVKGNVKVGGKDTVLVEVTGSNGETVAGGVHRYLIWLDAVTILPLKVRSFDQKDSLIEDVAMDDLEIDVTLPDSLFEI